jgi:hypothetical protein
VETIGEKKFGKNTKLQSDEGGKISVAVLIAVTCYFTRLNFKRINPF